MTWEKAKNTEKLKKGKNNRWKFLLAGILVLGAIAYLVFTSTVSGARFFITVDEVLANPNYQGQSVRLSGAVLGDTINYDSETGTLEFTIVNIPREFTDLAQTLHDAVNNPNSQQLKIHMDNTVKPDLLKHEAQAILTGKLGEDGIFYATELNLKCPTRFQEGPPKTLNS